MTTNKKRNSITLYSILPLQLSTLGFSLLFPPAILLTAIITTIISTFVLFAVLFVLLLTTGNKKLLPLKRLLFISFLTVLLANAYSFIADLFLRYKYLGQSLPLSYSLDPQLYNRVTQFLVPGILTLFLLYLFLRRFKPNKLILICFVASLLTLPWLELPQRSTQATNEAANISPKKLDEIKKGISVNYLGEELAADPKNKDYKLLRVKAKITVPLEGTYHLLPSMSSLGKQEKDPRLFSPPPYVFYINEVNDPEIKGIKLVEGVNETSFDFPYIFADTYKSKEINLSINNQFYGPYKVRFYIQGIETKDGVIRPDYASPVYTTKQYQQEDFSGTLQ